jgi:ABC-type bacteriocin/lantibiotic exporter with double-glycine peptidase domain
MDAGPFNTSESSAHRNLELWTGLSRQLLFVIIGIHLLRIQHTDDRGGISQQTTPLLDADLEANYNTVSQSLPRRKKESWSNRLLCFLVHVWPNSIGLRVLFLSTILLLFLQPVVNLLLPYFLSIFLERTFQMRNEPKSSDSSVLQALGTYLVFRTLGKSLDLLPKSLWNRIMQSGIRGGTNTALGNVLDKEEDWNTRYSTSEKLFAIGKFRAVIKFTTEVLFGIVPTIIDLLLAVGFAANRFGPLCAVMITLAGLFFICFLLWSSKRTAHLEKVRSDAKARIEELRYGTPIDNYTG